MSKAEREYRITLVLVVIFIVLLLMGAGAVVYLTADSVC